MCCEDGGLSCGSNDARDIVILDADNKPKVFSGGIIASKTKSEIKGFPKSDPKAYVDAEAVLCVVVPPLIVHKTVGVIE